MSRRANPANVPAATPDAANVSSLENENESDESQEEEEEDETETETGTSKAGRKARPFKLHAWPDDLPEGVERIEMVVTLASAVKNDAGDIVTPARTVTVTSPPMPMVRKAQAGADLHAWQKVRNDAVSDSANLTLIHAIRRAIFDGATAAVKRTKDPLEAEKVPQLIVDPTRVKVVSKLDIATSQWKSKAESGVATSIADLIALAKAAGMTIVE